MLNVQLHSVERLGRTSKAKIVFVPRDILANIASKHSVPDNENTTIIAITRRTVMHAMRRRRRKNVLQGPEPTDQLRVNPELIQRIETLVSTKCRGTEDQSQRQIPERGRYCLQDALPQSSRQIVDLAGMVHSMPRPEEMPLVITPVQTVISEIHRKHQGKKRQIRVFTSIVVDDSKAVVHHGVQRLCQLYHTDLGENVPQHHHNATSQRSDGVIKVVFGLSK
mmetsp:Transcript_2493/g.5609  ORF Transcript_2493/g.5609 Transcript_2493/m.5609 type:complete len:223 (+) Transcript_2493:226-894(+)